MIGVVMIGWIHSDITNEEKGLMIRFGEDYRGYMQRVPRFNIVWGIIKLLLRRYKETQ
jgi:protein-S-isoprenylcysteine O-methyltransferase Ste14